MAYVDESYDKDSYFIGAAVAHEATWDALEEDLEIIRERTSELHGTPIDAEFHGHEIMSGRRPWKVLRGEHREAAGVYAAVLRASRAAGIEYVFRGVDVRRLNARYRYPRPPHTVVLGHLLERLDDFAKLRGRGEQIIIVADEIADQAEHQVQFEAYQRLGTDDYRSSRLTHISAPINFADSRWSPGLQVADMATYIHRRSSSMTVQHPKAQATTD